MLNQPITKKNSQKNPLVNWLVTKQLAKSEKDAQAVVLLFYLLIIFALYWFFFVNENTTPISRDLIENAGSVDEIVNS